jgi:hypothetical protein
MTTRIHNNNQFIAGQVVEVKQGYPDQGQQFTIGRTGKSTILPSYYDANRGQWHSEHELIFVSDGACEQSAMEADEHLNYLALREMMGSMDTPTLSTDTIDMELYQVIREAMYLERALLLEI